MAELRKIRTKAIMAHQGDLVGWHLGNGGVSDVSLVKIPPELYNAFVEVVQKTWRDAKVTLTRETLEVAASERRAWFVIQGRKLSLNLILEDLREGRAFFSFALPPLYFPHDHEEKQVGDKEMLGMREWVRRQEVAEKVLDLSGLSRCGIVWEKGCYRGSVMLYRSEFRAFFESLQPKKPLDRPIQEVLFTDD